MLKREFGATRRAVDDERLAAVVVNGNRAITLPKRRRK
jgi:hypothetical protein